jgi:hypothetical protein
MHRRDFERAIDKLADCLVEQAEPRYIEQQVLAVFDLIIAARTIEKQTKGFVLA